MCSSNHFTLGASKMKASLFLCTLLLMPPPLPTNKSCKSDKDPDNRARVTCEKGGLTAVPSSLPDTTEVLILHFNSFTTISWEAFAGFPQLFELDLSHNHISLLEKGNPPFAGPGDGGVSSWNLGKLAKLHLVNNSISTLAEDIFQPFPNLMELFLSGNKIKIFPEQIFNGLNKLEKLDISSNSIKVLPADLINHLPKLKHFDVQDNQMQFLPDGFFPDREIPYAFLGRNPWFCNCKMEYLRNWVEEQSHNIYMLTNGTIENSPESVVCFGPARLQKHEVQNLENSDICPADGIVETFATTTQFLTTFETSSFIPNLTTEIKTMRTDTTSITMAPSSSATSSSMSTLRHVTSTLIQTTSLVPSEETSQPTTSDFLPSSMATSAPSQETSFSTVASLHPIHTTKSGFLVETSQYPVTTMVTVLSGVMNTTELDYIWDIAGGHQERRGTSHNENPVVLFCLLLFSWCLASCLLLIVSTCLLLYWIWRLYFKFYRPAKKLLLKPPNVRLIRYSTLLRNEEGKSTSWLNDTLEHPRIEEADFCEPEDLCSSNEVGRMSSISLDEGLDGSAF
ncbi:SLIT and NTRK-like protein 6 isoform X1 [Polypterus senegalus]|uniref:SLIT and NTRK-like protein 6 isoform X1 n=1 Tax=Polypterus senegalus TaxID=55291 RepID=UPI0019662897|nr:SLIT and NTRK-like protein 6 isoform X1 [Polypterus senegalus]